MQRKKISTSESYCPSMSLRLNLTKRTPNYATHNLSTQRKRVNTFQTTRKSDQNPKKEQKIMGSSRNLYGKLGNGKSGLTKQIPSFLMERGRYQGKVPGKGKYSAKPMTFSKINSNRNIGISSK